MSGAAHPWDSSGGGAGGFFGNKLVKGRGGVLCVVAGGIWGSTTCVPRQCQLPQQGPRAGARGHRGSQHSPSLSSASTSWLGVGLGPPAVITEPKNSERNWGGRGRCQGGVRPSPAPRHIRARPPPSCEGASLAQLLPPPPPPPGGRFLWDEGCAGGRWGWGVPPNPPRSCRFPWQPCRTRGHRRSRQTGQARGRCCMGRRRVSGGGVGAVHSGPYWWQRLPVGCGGLGAALGVQEGGQDQVCLHQGVFQGEDRRPGGTEGLSTGGSGKHGAARAAAPTCRARRSGW